jgi:CRISPR/Cas system CSM-associated protein Csm3 (group 7 of RAMP superfamily)
MKLATLTATHHDYLTTYSLTATIDSALCIGAGGSSGSLADKSIVRASDGRMLIPGSHLKGRLRHECEKLARALGLPVSESPNPGRMMEQADCIISEIFGNPQTPSKLIVSDLLCDIAPDLLPPEVIRPGVSINRRRGTAEDEKLYFLETSPPNQQLQFTGQLQFIHMPTYAIPLIAAGLHHIHALGGSKSAGLGWLTWDLPEGLKTIPKDHPGWSRLSGSTAPGATP